VHKNVVKLHEEVKKNIKGNKVKKQGEMQMRKKEAGVILSP